MVRAVLHIGPPKTATTSLQECVIPYLGKPFQIKPNWTRPVCRSKSFEVPELPPDIVVSDERLADFLVFSPHVIAERLAQIFKNALVLFVRRNPLEHFYSVYRQALLNTASGFATNGVRRPIAADQFFDKELERFQNAGVGFFAMNNASELAEAFGQFFDIKMFDFDNLKLDSAAFVNEFAAACAGESIANPNLTHKNQSDVKLLASALHSVSDRSPALHFLYLEKYIGCQLSEDRAEFLTREPCASQKHSNKAHVVMSRSELSSLSFETRPFCG